MSVGKLLARAGSGALAVKVAGAAVAFAMQVVLARLLGPADYGIYAYVAAWTVLLATAAQLGFDTALLRFVAAYRAQRKWAELRGVLRTAPAVVLAGSTVIASAVVLVTALTLGPEQGTMRATFWIAATLLLPVMALLPSLGSTLRGLGAYVRPGIPDLLVRPVVLMLLLGVSYLALGGIAAPHAMLLNALAAAVALAISLVWLRRQVPPAVRQAPPVYHVSLWLTTAAPMLLLAGIYMILSRADIIMVGYFLGPQAAGAYTAASRMSELTLFGLASTNVVVGPLIAELHARGEWRKLRRMVTLAARGTAAVTLAAIGFLAIAGESLLGLFGPTFTDSYPVLLLLLIGHAMNALCGPVALMLTMTGRQMTAAYISGAAALLNIVLNAALIPAYGAAGAAMATVAATAFWNLGMAAYVRTKLGVNATIIARLEPDSA